jgi:phage virion morphogenesis protein
MTAAAIVIDDSDIQEGLQRVLDAAGDLAPVLKNIGEYEAEETKDRFRDQLDPDGQPWEPLNALYKTTKKGPRILTGQTRSLSEIVWQLASQTSVEVGSNVVYARIHNEGGIIKPKSAAALVFSMGGQTFKVKSVRIPRRTFLGINEEDRREIEAIIRDHFEEAIARTGGQK